jgi:hypothetical protein
MLPCWRYPFKGKFEVLVTITGELQAERSEQIMGPAELRSRNLRIGNIRIQDLIPEGTVVDSGDYVALLDRSESDNALLKIWKMSWNGPKHSIQGPSSILPSPSVISVMN